MKNQNKLRYCTQPSMKERSFDINIHPGRMEAILLLDKKWVNGTKLKYYFFTGNTFYTSVPQSNGTTKKIFWKATTNEKKAVRKAFKAWADLGIGIEFEETTDRLDATVRIGFANGEGSWSYVGRDMWSRPKEERTMNFGWDVVRDQDTIIHEIGHALGLPHEHQNPNAGIIWNEENVYRALAAPPNNWSRSQTFNNIIKKISLNEFQGSNWDPDSIMHYPFGAGMIDSPIEYNNGLTPNPGLSPRDKTWIKLFYPKIDKRKYLNLKVYESELIAIKKREQLDFEFTPIETRTYTIRTFGFMDTVMVLSEVINGDKEYLSGDDDSGEDRNSNIKIKLIKGKKYIVNLRLYYKTSAGQTCLMVW